MDKTSGLGDDRTCHGQNNLSAQPQAEKYIQQIQDEVDAASSLGIKVHYMEELPLPLT